MFCGKVKRLEKDLAEMRKQLWQARMSAAEAAEELQKIEIELWQREKNQKELDFRNHRVKARLKHDLWDKISPVFFLEGKNRCV